MNSCWRLVRGSIFIPLVSSENVWQNQRVQKPVQKRPPPLGKPPTEGQERPGHPDWGQSGGGAAAVSGAGHRVTPSANDGLFVHRTALERR